MEELQLKRITNILYIISLVYFVIMIVSDIIYATNNTEDISKSISPEQENMIFSIIMLIPLIFLIIISIVFEIICKKNNIRTVNSVIFGFLKKYFMIFSICFILIILIAFIVLIYILQDKIIYQPFNADLIQSKLEDSKQELNIEDITIKNNDLFYHGWGHKSGSDKPTIIYYGGNAQVSAVTFYTMDDYWKYYEGYNFVMIDYPGYGMSDGSPNYNDILEMSLATYDYIDKDSYYGNNDIIIMGFSIGTGPATYVAANRYINKLILVAPYSNGIDLYNSHINIFHGPIKNLVKNTYQSDVLATKINQPSLIIASKDDEVISYSMSEKLANKFNNSTLITYSGLYHNDLCYDTKVLKEINQFMNK